MDVVNSFRRGRGEVVLARLGFRAFNDTVTHSSHCLAIVTQKCRSIE